MEEKCYTVYMHKNKINNKIYIGITKLKPKDRWNNGLGYNKQSKFYRAIKKYGWDNFEHIILFDNLTKDEACEKEIKLISYYDSSNCEKGYNISKGGKANNGVPCYEKTKIKISIANKGENNGYFGKKHTKEELKKISEASKKMWQKKEHRDKMLKVLNKYKKDFKKGNVPWNKGMKGFIIPSNMKKVICVETGEIFCSIKEAEKNKKTSNISACCRGIHKTAGGYHWKYYEINKEEKKDEEEK